jgi:hypothetical protein
MNRAARIYKNLVPVSRHAFDHMFGFFGNHFGAPKIGLDRQVKNASMWMALTGQAPASDSQNLDLSHRLLMLCSVGHVT